MSSSRSTYTADFVDDEMKNINENRELSSQKFNSILVDLKKLSTLWKDFINAHGRAVITLTQVDTKLTQLELLDKTDNTGEENARGMEKDLGNLQVNLN